MNKIEIVDEFEKKLNSIRINSERKSPYHIQVQRIHNFYPTTMVYYNSDTFVKKRFKKDITDSHGSFCQFLSSNAIQ